MFKNTQIILVETTNSGNIGSSARALKTMGLSELALINPQAKIDKHAYALSSNATDILDNIKIYPDISSAIKKSQLVIATSARKRNKRWVEVNPKEAAQLILENEKHNIQSSIIFGREKNGLLNEELKLANYLLYIPSNEEYNSLNLAMAVQILTYEIQAASQQITKSNKKFIEKASAKEINNMHLSLEQLLEQLNFFNEKTKKTTMLKIISMLNRIEGSKKEIQMIRGFIAKITYLFNK